MKKVVKKTERVSLKKNLFIINHPDDSTTELWGLNGGKAPRPQKWQLDLQQEFMAVENKYKYRFLDKLRLQANGLDKIKSQQAVDALVFYNAFFAAELQGNFDLLDQLGVKYSDEFKKQMFRDRNNRRECLFSRGCFASSRVALEKLDSNEFKDQFEYGDTTIGSAHGDMTAVRTRLRKAKIPVETFYKERELRGEKPVETINGKQKRKPKAKREIAPGRRYTPEEIANFEKHYGLQVAVIAEAEEKRRAICENAETARYTQAALEDKAETVRYTQAALEEAA